MNNKVIFAHNVGRKDGPFRCTFCHSDMILRKGKVKIAHFAHKKGSNCPYATGETIEHEMAKFNLYNLAKSKGIEVKMEDVLSDHVRADLTLITDNCKIAIEFQKSGMTDEQAKLRMKHYAETGIPVIWIMLKNKNYPDETRDITVTTKDIIFYEMYGFQLFTLYKDDLIDVWRLRPIDAHQHYQYMDYEEGEFKDYWSSYTLKTFRMVSHLGRLSLLEPDTFMVVNRKLLNNVWAKLILPKPGKVYGKNLRSCHNGETIYIESYDGGSDFKYDSYSQDGIIVHNEGHQFFNIPWNNMCGVYYYSNKGFLIPFYLPKPIRMMLIQESSESQIEARRKIESIKQKQLQEPIPDSKYIAFCLRRIAKFEYTSKRITTKSGWLENAYGISFNIQKMNSILKNHSLYEIQKMPDNGFIEAVLAKKIQTGEMESQIVASIKLDRGDI